MNRTVRFLGRKAKRTGVHIAKLGIRVFARGSLLLKSRFMNNRTLEIHFFTIVLNGMPFIKYYIETFRKLNCPWKWHIVEGVADLKHDTAWSLQFGARITDYLHKDGISNDGTSEYVDELAKQYPKNIHIYRKPKGQFWDGKVEMCNVVLRNIQKECLLWQIDVDEFWSASQIETVLRMFEERPEKTAAWFYCYYFVGPRLIITSRNHYGNNPVYEWVRVWRYKPGMSWVTHEPPYLALRTKLGICDVGKINPFTHKETESRNLVFEHYAYVLPRQLLFKEIYYGYHNALLQWRRLQECKVFPTYLRYFFPWVKDKAVVDVFKPSILSDIMSEKWNELSQAGASIALDEID